VSPRRLYSEVSGAEQSESEHELLAKDATLELQLWKQSIEEAADFMLTGLAHLRGES
jgi:hypothetical protein